MISSHRNLRPRDTVIIHNHPIHYKHLLFKSLQERGLHFCVLFVGAAPSDRHEKIDVAGCEYECSFLSSLPFGAAGFRNTMRTVVRTWSALDRLNPRVVVMGGYHMAASWAAWVWAGLHGRRRVLWFESNQFDWPRVGWKERVKSLFVRRCDQAHAYGTSSKEYLERLGMAPERIGIKRAVVDVVKFSGVQKARRVRTEARSERTLIFVGRLAPEKNLPFVLQALQVMRARGVSPEFRLVVVGTGPEESGWRSLVKELRLESVVEFVGYQTQAELPAFFGRSDILVLPSTREPYGLVVLEAMAAGLPVLVSDRCGCAVDVVTPETGWLFSPDDLETLVGRLTEISQMSNQELHQMGVAARQVACEYGPGESAARVMSLVGRPMRRSAEPMTEARLEASGRL